MKRRAPWENNVESFMVLYSILALISVAFLVYAFDEEPCLNWHFWFIHLPLGLSLIGFIYSAEQTVNAADEDDVEKYIFTFAVYDVAVILLLLGLQSIIYFKFFLNLTSSLCFQIVIFVGALVILTWHWLSDLKWLFTCKETDFKEYEGGLKGINDPVRDRDCLFDFFYFLRKINPFSKNKK